MALVSYQVSGYFTQRLSALAEFELAMDRVGQVEDILKTDLHSSVPERLRTFVEDQGVIDNVLKYGVFCDRYGYNIDGLKTYKSLKVALDELQVAWQKNIRIQLDPPGESGRVSIRYDATPH